MTLAARTRLGRYEIVAPLGAGGMGEVYRARDLELDRTVAVKILPSRVASNPELRTRFEREARVVSALNHPNICTLHDVGREGEIAFFVMELLDGESLAERMAKGPLPIETALSIAAQIASALAAAHRRGIVHRDLKPANVMLTRGGVKLLDFGIARLGAATGSQSDDSAPPTIAGPITAEGTILGTLQYMAPEQLEGKPTDARADLFSFGCMLYEMIAGRRAFSGSSQASLITAIMSSEPPPLPALAPLASGAVDRLVRKCLAKSPDDRWQNASDLETELRWIGEDRGGGAPATSRAKRPNWIWPVIALLAFAALVGTMLRSGRATAPAAVLRATIANPGSIGPGVLTPLLAVSPDGQHVAFVAARDGRESVWIRTLAEEEARPLPETEDPGSIVWSPDSKSLAFVAAARLQRIDRSGGEPQTICPISPGALLHMTWGADGTIVFAELSGKRGLFRVPASGGQPAAIPVADPGGALRLAWPAFIGDSKQLLYEVVGPSGTGRLFAVTLDSAAPPRALGPIPSRVEVVGDTMLYVRDSTLFAQRFDRSSLQRTGEPVRIASHVLYYVSLGGAAFAASNGVIVYATSVLDSRLTWFDRSGNATDLGTGGRVRGMPRLTRDGAKAAVTSIDSKGGTADLWTVDLIRDAPVRVTSSAASKGSPVWSPDGSRIAFQSDVDGPPHIFMQTLSAATAEPVTPVRGIQYTSDWTPDGKTIVFDESNPATRRDILLVDARPNSTPRIWLQTPFYEYRGRVSPDGKWMSFVSNASGRYEVYVAPFDRPAQSVQVSSGGGNASAWRGDGAELFYATTDGKIFSVAVRTTPRFEAAPPKLVFRNTEGNWEGFDAAADGSRFLITRTLHSARTLPTELVMNWRALLDQPPR